MLLALWLGTTLVCIPIGFCFHLASLFLEKYEFDISNKSKTESLTMWLLNCWADVLQLQKPNAEVAKEGIIN